MNDATSGYCSNFYIYEGKTENRPQGIEATVYPYYRLVAHPGEWNPDQYLNKNHVNNTDNWFSSLAQTRLTRST